MRVSSETAVKTQVYSRPASVLLGVRWTQNIRILFVLVGIWVWAGLLGRLSRIGLGLRGSSCRLGLARERRRPGRSEMVGKVREGKGRKFILGFRNQYGLVLVVRKGKWKCFRDAGRRGRGFFVPMRNSLSRSSRKHSKSRFPWSFSNH